MCNGVCVELPFLVSMLNHVALAHLLLKDDTFRSRGLEVTLSLRKQRMLQAWIGAVGHGAVRHS